MDGWILCDQCITVLVRGEARAAKFRGNLKDLIIDNDQTIATRCERCFDETKRKVNQKFLVSGQESVPRDQKVIFT